MRKIRRWTSKEEQFLVDNYATHSNKRLSEMMKRSVPSICNRAQLLGLKTEPNQYALYKGDELLRIGAINEIAAAENVKPETIRFYRTPIHKKRRKNGKSYREVVCLDE